MFGNTRKASLTDLAHLLSNKDTSIEVNHFLGLPKTAQLVGRQKGVFEFEENYLVDKLIESSKIYSDLRLPQSTSKQSRNYSRECHSRTTDSMH